MEYRLIRKKRKTLAIKISEAGEVIVYAPLRTSVNLIENILEKKSHWVNEARFKVLEAQNLYGDDIPFLGKRYGRNIMEKKGKKIDIEFTGAQFNVYLNEEGHAEADIKKALHLWYREELAKILDERIGHFSRRIGVKPNKVSIRSQKTIWGSCTRDNNLSINLKLSLAPLDVIDYIVVHELCHITHKNHSREFWLAVESAMPDYRKKKDWLKLNGCSLILF
ncbi:MAG: M48 family metallopeptidase [Clostridiaceae bacterium]